MVYGTCRYLDPRRFFLYKFCTLNPDLCYSMIYYSICVPVIKQMQIKNETNWIRRLAGIVFQWTRIKPFHLFLYPEESCNISLQKFVSVLDRSNPEDITALGKNLLAVIFIFPGELSVGNKNIHLKNRYLFNGMPYST